MTNADPEAKGGLPYPARWCGEWWWQFARALADQGNPRPKTLKTFLHNSQLVSGASLELSPASRPFSCLAAS